MKESHYNMQNVETLDTTMWHHCAAASITTKKETKVDLGKFVQMYRAPFLYLPGAPNSLNPPLNISKSSQKGGREGRTTKTQKSLLHTITYIKQKTLPSINGRGPGPTDSRCCTFTRHYFQEATDPICFSTHVRCKPVLYYCLLRSCKTSKKHSLLH